MPRPPLGASPLYRGQGGRQNGGSYRAGSRYNNRYGYGGGRVRFARTPGYARYTHVRYPGYSRPRAYGSFFYFPGYGFNLGVGFGYPGAFGRYGYSGYASYPYGYGGYGYGGYGYGGYGYNYGGSYADAYTGFLRLKVKPRDAQVFVDGSYVGVVDHFDGIFQRLRLEEGTHYIELRHPGYLPVEFEVLIVVGEKVTFEEFMILR